MDIPTNLDMESATLLQHISDEINRLSTPWADKKGAAEYIRKSTRDLDRLIGMGDLKAYYCGDSPRFKKADLDRLMREKKYKIEDK